MLVLPCLLSCTFGRMEGYWVVNSVNCVCLLNVRRSSLSRRYVDFLDTSGTLLALVIAMGIADEHGDFEGSRQAFAADACATIAGSFFGLSPVTSYIESAAGVEAGSRTGMTAVFCGIFFLMSIFFAPIIASIPPVSRLTQNALFPTILIRAFYLMSFPCSSIIL